jgi:hypothetical protein
VRNLRHILCHERTLMCMVSDPHLKCEQRLELPWLFFDCNRFMYCRHESDESTCTLPCRPETSRCEGNARHTKSFGKKTGRTHVRSNHRFRCQPSFHMPLRADQVHQLVIKIVIHGPIILKRFEFILRVSQNFAHNLANFSSMIREQSLERSLCRG